MEYEIFTVMAKILSYMKFELRKNLIFHSLLNGKEMEAFTPFSLIHFFTMTFLLVFTLTLCLIKVELVRIEEKEPNSKESNEAF